VVPGKQVMHIDDPASEYVFAGHGPEQFTEGRPVTLPKRPAGHAMHSTAFKDAENRPVGHVCATVLFGAQNDPACDVQLDVDVHEAEPIVLVFPAPQSVQETEPTPLLNRPAGHKSHTMDPVCAEKLPA